MISLGEARALLLDGAAPLAAEEIALADAAGRILADDIVASFDQPALPTSAMDGYAVTAADAVAGTRLRVVGDAFAGTPFAGRIERGTTVRIATGGVVPGGAERVIMQEIVARDGDDVTLTGPIHDEHFIRPHGGDFRQGERLLAAGQVLTPGALGLAAAANHASLPVRTRPRVAIFASGDELREAGEKLAPGEVVNSAGHAIASLIALWGGKADRMTTLADDSSAIRSAIAGQRDHADILLFIGGASVGERDYLRAVVADLGGKICFDKIAVQPGKPCWHARFADGRLLLGLPGNPASAFVCAHLLLEPLLAAMLGRETSLPMLSATLDTPMPAGTARETWWRANAAIDGGGRLIVTPDPRRDSSLQRPLAMANALIRRPSGVAASLAGEAGEIILISGTSLKPA